MSVIIAALTASVVVSIIVTYVLTQRRLEVIHDLVNSNLTKVQADLVVAQRRIELLEKHLATE